MATRSTLFSAAVSIRSASSLADLSQRQPVGLQPSDLVQQLHVRLVVDSPGGAGLLSRRQQTDRRCSSRWYCDRRHSRARARIWSVGLMSRPSLLLAAPAGTGSRRWGRHRCEGPSPRRPSAPSPTSASGRHPARGSPRADGTRATPCEPARPGRTSRPPRPCSQRPRTGPAHAGPLP